LEYRDNEVYNITISHIIVSVNNHYTQPFPSQHL